MLKRSGSVTITAAVLLSATAGDAYGHVDIMPTAQYWQRELFADQYGNSARTSNWAIDVAIRSWPF